MLFKGYPLLGWLELWSNSTHERLYNPWISGSQVSEIMTCEHIDTNSIYTHRCSWETEKKNQESKKIITVR